MTRVGDAFLGAGEGRGDTTLQAEVPWLTFVPAGK